MTFNVIEGDITQVHVDAIVNAANEALLAGGGVCGAIFEAAGYDRLQAACDKIGHCAPGGAVITPGFDLPAKYVIHTPGPVWFGGCRNEEETLRSCYRSALELASENGCKSIAFPLISSGIFGYPYAEALRVARESILEYLKQSDMEVFLVLYRRA